MDKPYTTSPSIIDVRRSRADLEVVTGTEIVKIRRVSMCDVLRRKSNQNQELLLNDVTSEFHDSSTRSSPTLCTGSQLRDHYSMEHDIRAPSIISAPRKQMHREGKESHHDSKSSGSLDLMVKHDVCLAARLQEMDNSKSWFSALREGIDLLAAIQIVDRGEERDQDRKG